MIVPSRAKTLPSPAPSAFPVDFYIQFYNNGETWHVTELSAGGGAAVQVNDGNTYEFGIVAPTPSKIAAFYPGILGFASPFAIEFRSSIDGGSSFNVAFTDPNSHDDGYGYDYKDNLYNDLLDTDIIWFGTIGYYQSPSDGIRRVIISTDGGVSWNSYNLGGPFHHVADGTNYNTDIFYGFVASLHDGQHAYLFYETTYNVWVDGTPGGYVYDHSVLGVYKVKSDGTFTYKTVNNPFPGNLSRFFVGSIAYSNQDRVVLINDFEEDVYYYDWTANTISAGPLRVNGGVAHEWGGNQRNLITTRTGALVFVNCGFAPPEYTNQYVHVSVSRDNGATWTLTDLTAYLPVGIFINGQGISVHVDYNGNLYIPMSDWGVVTGGAFSIDDGETWQQAGDFLLQSQIIYSSGVGRA